MDFRTYLTLEVALTRRLQRSWAKLSGPTYREIEDCVSRGDYDAARAAAQTLDMRPLGEQNREAIKYILLNTAIFGAGLAHDDAPQFLHTGDHNALLTSATEQMVSYFDHGGTDAVQQEALQLIADAQKTVQKREYEYGNTQINIDPTSEAAKALDALRDSIPDKHLMSHGKDVGENHVTVRWGIQGDDVDGIRRYIQDQQPFTATLGEPEVFDPGKHSDGACPVVIRVESPELHRMNAEIEKHGDFKEPSFSSYKPHATLAYVDPKVRDQYESLPAVKGKTFPVNSITVSHRDGTHEDVFFGTKQAADDRYVKPFVSFADGGMNTIQLASTLNSSRLAVWGFLAEADLKRLTEYVLVAVLDNRTSPFCEMINGKKFSVADARDFVTKALAVQDPNDLKTLHPWPNQSKSSIEMLSKLSTAELKARGYFVPPFHPGCRTLCARVGVMPKNLPTVATGTALPEENSTQESLAFAGTYTDKQVSQWNSVVGSNPVQVVAALMQAPPSEVLDGHVGTKISFNENGNVSLYSTYSAPDFKRQVGTIFDPFTRRFYLDRADLITADPKLAAGYLRKLFSRMIDVGSTAKMSSIVVGAAAGEAGYYAAMGLTPSPLDWQYLRSDAMVPDSEFMKAVGLLPADEQKVVLSVLQSNNEQSLSVLMEIKVPGEVTSFGELLLHSFSGNMNLDLTSVTAVDKAKGVLDESEASTAE